MKAEPVQEFDWAEVKEAADEECITARIFPQSTRNYLPCAPRDTAAGRRCGEIHRPCRENHRCDFHQTLPRPVALAPGEQAMLKGKDPAKFHAQLQVAAHRNVGEEKEGKHPSR